MRLASVSASVALSAVLLSGCSFITGKPGSYQNPFAKQKAASHGQYAYGAQAKAAQRCQIYSPQQRPPQGCRPDQVTLAVGPQGPYGQAQHHSTNGFPQQPNYGQPQYASGAYGTAVGQAGAQSAQYKSGPKLKKPKLRGSLSLGVEKSVSGNLIDQALFPIAPVGLYNPQDFNEGFVEGADATGDQVITTYTANQQTANGNYFAPNTYDSISSPDISLDDAWSTPVRLSGGLEYIANKRTTFFANGGYTQAEGNSGTGATVEATLYRVTEAGTYDFNPAIPGSAAVPAIPGTPEIPAIFNPLTGELITPGVPATPGSPAIPAVAAIPESYTRTGTLTSASFVPNETIAEFDYDFSDLRRFDLEAGARHYFKPIVKSEGYRTVTPFIGASAGASHYDKVDLKISQRQRFYERGFELNGAEPTADTPTQFYDVASPVSTVTVFDSQWVPSGQVNVGAEWQVTPGFALAAESGMRVEGGRKYTNGERADTNISIPFTLRGSVNF